MTIKQVLQCSTDSIHIEDSNYELAELGGRKLSARFDGKEVTSHAGVSLVAKFAENSGFFDALADAIPDYRNPAMVEHKMGKLVRQLILGDLIGCPDFTDHDTLRNDPIMLLALAGEQWNDRKSRPRLAGRNTVQRIIDRPSKEESGEKTVERMVRQLNKYLVGLFVASLGDISEDDEFILEMDSTYTVLHGKQEGAYYNAHCGNYCYHLQVIYCRNFPLAVRLITSDKGAAHDACSMFVETIENLRELVGKKVSTWVRADSAFCNDEIMDYVEKRNDAGENTYYVLGLAQNKVLNDNLGEQLVANGDDWKKLSDQVQQSGKKDVRFYGFSYQTRNSWSTTRWISAKSEFLPEEGKMLALWNRRYVVSNYFAPPEEVYTKLYCPRGDMENKIKEGKLDFDLKHASLRRMTSNKVRLYFKIFSQTLMNLFKNFMLKGTEFETATGGTIREKLINFGALFQDTHRRFQFSLAEGFTHKKTFDIAYNRIDQAVETLQSFIVRFRIESWLHNSSEEPTLESRSSMCESEFVQEAPT